MKNGLFCALAAVWLGTSVPAQGQPLRPAQPVNDYRLPPLPLPAAPTPNPDAPGSAKAPVNTVAGTASHVRTSIWPASAGRSKRLPQSDMMVDQGPGPLANNLAAGLPLNNVVSNGMQGMNPMALNAEPGAFDQVRPPAHPDGEGETKPNDKPGCSIWVGGDYLLWWVRDAHTPPLVTRGSPTDPIPGALNQPGTATLFGGKIDQEEFSGGRVFAGMFIGENHLIGVDGSLFFIGQRTTEFAAASPGTTVLARPFFDAFLNTESSSLVSFPGLQQGSVDVRLDSRLWGGELNIRSEVMQTDGVGFHVLGGFRYLELSEALDIHEFDSLLPLGGVFGGLQVDEHDHFGALNCFYGGQIGGDLTLQWQNLSLELIGKCALGSNHEAVHIGGSKVTSTPVNTPASVIPSGELALPTNSGRHEQDVFAVVPEAGINLGYTFGKHWRASVGYTLLYVSDVVRPGDQIDRAVNPTGIPSPLGNVNLIGAARPTFQFHETDYWAQGINFGLEFRY
jgi:hypothetical protein